MSSSVFVLGAAGYIGEGVACAFRRAGFRVFGLVRDEQRAISLEKKEIFAVRGTLENWDSYSAILSQCAIIVDAVGYSHNPGCVPFFQQLVQHAAARIAVGGKSAKPVFLFTGGILVYGNVRELTSLSPIDESTIPKPGTADLKARFEFEKRVLATKELHATVLRPGYVYGGRGGKVADMYFGIDPKSADLGITGSGAKRWSWVHVDDLGQAYVLAAKRGALVAGEVFNIGAPCDSYTHHDVRVAMARAAGWQGSEVKESPVGPEHKFYGWEVTLTYS